jgi:hypothetical protein
VLVKLSDQRPAVVGRVQHFHGQEPAYQFQLGLKLTQPLVLRIAHPSDPSPRRSPDGPSQLVQLWVLVQHMQQRLLAGELRVHPDQLID